jgi:NAD(P)-dependent dehydrogenase (short-subunit alcohol dehydrogenase family)
MGERLAGKVAIVTGAASGIGAATAGLMVAEGASVVLADLNLSGAERVASRLGTNAVAQACDVMEESAVAALVQTALDRFGRLDVIHNNAVTSDPQDTDTINTPDAIWHRSFVLIVMAAVYACRHGIPAMLATGGGSIVNTSSGAAQNATGSRVTYGTAKAALEAMSMYTAKRFGSEGVRTNCVAPGFVLTEGTKDLFDDDTIARYGTSSALGRVCTPEDVADVVVFLASDESRYVNGQVVRVDGGGAKGLVW